MTRHAATQMRHRVLQRTTGALNPTSVEQGTAPPARATTHAPHEPKHRNSPTRALHDRHPTAAQNPRWKSTCYKHHAQTLADCGMQPARPHSTTPAHAPHLGCFHRSTRCGFDDQTQTRRRKVCRLACAGAADGAGLKPSKGTKPACKCTHCHTKQTWRNRTQRF